MSRSLYSVFLGICGLLFAAGSFPALAEDQVVRAFDQAVFGMDGNGQPALAKWVGPVRITVMGDSDAEGDTLLEQYVAEVSEVAGLDLDVVKAAPRGAARRAALAVFFGQPDAFIEFLEREGGAPSADLMARLRAGFCWSNLWIANDRIIRAVVFAKGASAPVEGRSGRRKCLYHELGHALGLPFHPQAFSVLNYESATDGHTDLDRRLLALLYHRALWPGMPRDATIEAVRKLVARQ